MNRLHAPGFPHLASIGIVLASFLSGCGQDETTVAQFTQSGTAKVPGLVKLVDAGHSGPQVAVTVALFGPLPAADLFQFRFGIEIGNPSLVRLIPQSSYGQTALTTVAGQTVSVEVNGTDPSLVTVETRKVGGGTGNGIAAAAVAVVQLHFEVLEAGSTTLTLVGLEGGAPQSTDSTGAPIAVVNFDDAKAVVAGVKSGGGGY